MELTHKINKKETITSIDATFNLKLNSQEEVKLFLDFIETMQDNVDGQREIYGHFNDIKSRKTFYTYILNKLKAIFTDGITREV